MGPMDVLRIGPFPMDIGCDEHTIHDDEVDKYSAYDVISITLTDPLSGIVKRFQQSSSIKRRTAWRTSPWSFSLLAMLSPPLRILRASVRKESKSSYADFDPGNQCLFRQRQ